MVENILLSISVILMSIFLGHCQGPLTPRLCGRKPSSCSNTHIRSYDGSCNNLEHTTWGMPQTRYRRLLPAHYGNGLDTPRLAKSGKALPNSRKVSYVVYPEKNIQDPLLTLSAMQFGQFIVHDMSMTTDNNQTKKEPVSCCNDKQKLVNFNNDPNQCYPIIVPEKDPEYSKYNIECFQFSRTGTDRDFECAIPNEPIQQLTQVTHYLDLSVVYGQNEKQIKELRLFSGGKMKFEERNGQIWLPRNKNVTGTCTVISNQEPCYLAGDLRANQSPHLTILHTIFVREHNRVADILSKLNPHWTDEKIFQEARKICIAQHQNIVYYEWLPNFLGKNNLLKRKIIYKTNDFVNDYNSSMDPSILNEHATAAFRFYHSSIAGSLDLVDAARKNDRDLRLSDWFNRPAVLEEGNKTFDELTRGLVTQRQYAADEFHEKEITNHWIRPIGGKIGQDLKSICIQRDRDHGLPSYNDLREYCGLPRAKKFKHFLDFISKKNVEKLESLYEHPDDVDLTVGGSLEVLVPGALAGPTFLCILTEQFYRSRVSDRFFFENSGPTGFTLPQLRELKKATISRIVCDNTRVKEIQTKGFEVIGRGNKVVPCAKLPLVNLSLWKEKK